MTEFDTVHTKISYWTVILAVLGQILLALPLLFDSSISAEERAWRELALYVGLGAFACLFFADLFRGYGLELIRDKFRPFSFMTVIRIAILIILLLGAQIVSKMMFMSIRGYEVALANIVAAPSEEMIFRGAMISFFMMLSKRTGRKDIKTFELQIVLKDDYNTETREFSLIEIVGIIISALAFSLYHENYYGNVPMLVSLFLWGMILGFAYAYWDDLTAVIFAHFIINFILAFMYLGTDWWRVIL